LGGVRLVVLMLVMDAEELIFIDWKSDVGFKWLFARDAVAEHLEAFLMDLAVDLLEQEVMRGRSVNKEHDVLGLRFLLGLKGRATDQLEYLNVEVVTREEKDSIRKVLFDIYVKLPGGNRVILEMQKAPHKDLDIRMLKYLVRGFESSGGISHVLVALMNFKFSEILGTFKEGGVVKVHEVVKKGVFVTVELGRFDKSLDELETGLDCWLFLFKNITKLKMVPEVFRGTIFEKIMEMSRIKTLPKEQKEDWKKELDNNRYVQEAIEINREQAFAEGVAEKEEAAINAYRKGKEEGVAEKEEAAINAYRKGKLNQLKTNIASMKSNGMTEEEIKAILDLEELPD
jgi:hypothetical protein